MKDKILSVIGLSLVLFFLSMPAAALRNGNAESRLKIRLIASKSSYMVGEIRSFDLELKNPGVEPVSFMNGLFPEAGYLKIYISKYGGNFKEYIGPRWGSDDKYYGYKTLAPNENVK